MTSHKFSVGDPVMLWNPPHRKGLSKSFQPKWQGPWVITKFIGTTNCRLEKVTMPNSLCDHKIYSDDNNSSNEVE